MASILCFQLFGEILKSSNWLSSSKYLPYTLCILQHFKNELHHVLVKIGMLDWYIGSESASLTFILARKMTKFAKSLPSHCQVTTNALSKINQSIINKKYQLHCHGYPKSSVRVKNLYKTWFVNFVSNFGPK